MNEFKTGCNIPAELPASILPPSFAAVVGVLTDGQIAEILSDPQRKSSRERFPNERFLFNQNPLNSCNAYATKGAFMRAREMQGASYVDVWAEAQYSMINHGRDQGSLLIDAFRAMQTHGFPSLASARGNHKIYQANRVPAEAWEEAKKYRVVADECYHVRTERELVSALALGFVGNVAVHVGRGYMDLDSRGVCRGGNGPGNHAVCVDDVTIDPGSGGYLINSPGSWGTNVGDNGHWRFAWDQHLQTSVNYHGFFVIRSVVSDESLPTIVA